MRGDVARRRELRSGDGVSFADYTAVTTGVA
jgi:hypothetical protein